MIGRANGSAISITGLGVSVPDRVVTNADLADRVETSDEWIFTRTGIKERRLADGPLAMSDLAAPACERALEMSGVDPASIDLLIVATVTPDMAFPSTAALLADRLEMPEAAAYDLAAGCTGFVYALAGDELEDLVDQQHRVAMREHRLDRRLVHVGHAESRSRRPLRPRWA